MSGDIPHHSSSPESAHDGDDIILSEETTIPGRSLPAAHAPLTPHDLAAAYVLDVLAVDEHAAFELHLAECADCQRTVAALRPVVDLLPDAMVTAPAVTPDTYPYLLRDVAHETLPSPPPVIRVGSEQRPNIRLAEDREPIGFRERHNRPIIASPPVSPGDPGESGSEDQSDPLDDGYIGQTQPASRPPGRIRPGYRPPAGSPEADRPRPPGMRASPAAVAALLIGIAGMAIFFWALILQGRVNSLQGEISAQATELAQIRAQSNATAYTLAPTIDGPPTGSGTFFFSLPDQRGALVVRGLNSAPDGQTYQIWYLQNGADPVAGPLFQVTPQGDAVVPLTASVVTFDGVAVSLEPAGGSDRPTTPLVLQGVLGGAAG